MGNKGAFIRFENDMVPHMTNFAAVVRRPAREPARLSLCCALGMQVAISAP